MKEVLLFVVGTALAQVNVFAQQDVVLDYSFDNEKDRSVYENDFINHGAVQAEDRFGNTEGALYFDGINDYLEIPADPSYQLTEFPFSVSVWVYLEDSSSSNNRIFQNGTGGTNYGGVMIAAAHRTSVSYGDGVGRGPADRKSFRGLDTLNSQKWHQIVVVSHSFDSTEIYLDGVLNQNITIDGTGASMQLASGATGKIGANLTQTVKNYFHGKIDELKMWRGALTYGEVIAMYNPNDGIILTFGEDEIVDGTIYPNPATNHIFVNQGIGAIEIYDMLGTQVLSINSLDGSIDVSNLGVGMYMLNTEKGVFKFVKE